MLKNYHVDRYGVIHQTEVNKITYDTNYVNSYNTYGEKTNYMSYLRLGFLMGALGYTPESILDVGYGNGAFLKACYPIINKCAGLDISGYPLPEGILMETNIFRTYEVISFFDSLEHFDDISFIKNLNTDFVMISVPNCEWGTDDVWFEKWKHRKPNEHLHHFNSDSLLKFMNASGYELVRESYCEDAIRQDPNLQRNILTAVYQKL